MAAPLPPTRRDAIRRRLVDWYRRSRRDLPWRRTRDPYRIWLSEAMLQQTRVETVIPYYERFLERFPDVGALAAADEEEVLRAWAGLGYYGRARNLKRAAQQIVREHGGRIPRDPASLRALPGVGAYTAGAVRSIAFRERAAIVDGNVRRVLSRLQAEPQASPQALWALAEVLTPDERPDLFNQALMELGALVCTPRAPRCASCPLTRLCRARATGRPADYPAARPRSAPLQVRALAGLLERGRPTPSILMLRRPSRGLLGGLWELPNVEGDEPRALLRWIRERTGVTARAAEPIGELRHLFSHRALSLRLIRLQAGKASPASAPPEGVRWCSPDELRQLPLSALMRRALALAGVRLEARYSLGDGGQARPRPG